MGTLGRSAYTVGFWIRETGQAMDRIGSRLRGNNFFKEQLATKLLHNSFVAGNNDQTEKINKHCSIDRITNPSHHRVLTVTAKRAANLEILPVTPQDIPKVDLDNVRALEEGVVDRLVEVEKEAEATKQALKHKISQAATSDVDYQSKSLPAKLRIEPEDPEDVVSKCAILWVEGH